MNTATRTAKRMQLYYSCEAFSRLGEQPTQEEIRVAVSEFVENENLACRFSPTTDELSDEQGYPGGPTLTIYLDENDRRFFVDDPDDVKWIALAEKFEDFVEARLNLVESAMTRYRDWIDF